MDTPSVNANEWHDNFASIRTCESLTHKKHRFRSSQKIANCQKLESKIIGIPAFGMNTHPAIESGTHSTVAVPLAKRPLLDWMIAAAYHVISVQVAVLIVLGAFARSRLQSTFFSNLDLHGRIHQFGNALAQGLSLGTLPVASQEIQQEKAQASAIATATVFVTHLAWLLLAISVLFLVYSILLHKDRPRQISRWTIRDLLGVSLIFLGVGLFAPVLSMIASQNVPVLGKVYAHFRSNTIVSAMGELFSSGNWFPATLVLLFSILTPIAKLATATAAATATPEKRAAIKRILDKIGKWSMADVFVVAILLAYLALGATDTSISAKPLWGFYFFSGYCLISMIVSFTLGHIRTEPDVSPPAFSLPSWADALVRGLFVITVFCCAGYGLIYFSLGKQAATYVTASVTHQQYEIKDTVLQLRAGSTTGVPLALPYSGRVDFAVHVQLGNAINVFVITPEQFANLRAGRRALVVEGSRAVNVRNCARSIDLERGLYYLGIRDTTLGILSAPTSEVTVQARLSP